MTPYALVMADGKKSKYGLNACLGALERLSSDDYPVVKWPSPTEGIDEITAHLASSGIRPIVLWSFYSPEFAEVRKRLSALQEVTFPAHLRPVHIAGGVHATAEPELTARAGFDYVAQGEGENTTLDLVSTLNDDGDLADVRGLGRLEDGIYSSSRGLAVEDLDEFPSFAIRQGRVGPIEITRGCVYACKFCQTPFMFKARFRHRSVASVIEHVRAQLALGLRDVRFISPTSLSYGTDDESPNLDAVDTLLAAVRAELPPDGRIFFGSFPSEIRPEHATVQALTIIKRWCDNDNVIIGAQSGSNRILSISHRGHDMESVRAAVDNCMAVGLKVNVDFIFGMPGETPDDVSATIDFCKELVAAGARIHTHTFMPLPGTPWSHEAPGHVGPGLRREIERLTAHGQAYGNWEQQQIIAQELSAFDSFVNRRKQQRRV